MHDFLLAKEIIDQLKKIAKERGLTRATAVKLEVGIVSLAHDAFPEHSEDIDLENLRFGLENIAKESVFEGAVFEIKKTGGSDWKITEISGE